MPKKGQGYDWSGDTPPIIDAHSLAKHRILAEYVQQYIKYLTANPRRPELSFTVIDGFAGGGEYVLEDNVTTHDGSPIILLNSVEKAAELVNAERIRSVSIDADFIFVERKPQVFAYLKNLLDRRRKAGVAWGARQTILLPGSFEENLDHVIKHVKAKGKSNRAIFVLDQYGYTSARMGLLAQIFQELPKSEIFLTLAAGWIWAFMRDPRSAAQYIGKALGVQDPYIEKVIGGQVDEEEFLRLDAPRSNEKLFLIQRVLHDVFSRHAGSRFYTPFFIVSRKSNRSFWFAHLANNERANDVVKALHWKVQNHFAHYGAPGLDMMLGYDPDRDLSVTGQFPFGFDDLARRRTFDRLLEQLPKRIRECFPDGVKFNDLYGVIGNETPADMQLLGDVVNELCRQQLLEKRGVEGEQRQYTTAVKGDDVIRDHPQGRLFLMR